MMHRKHRVLLWILINGLLLSSVVFAGQKTSHILPGIMDDLQLLAEQENPVRLEVLKHLLDKKGVAYAVESYTYSKNKFLEERGVKEEELSQRQRQWLARLIGEGDNLVVIMGSGNKEIIIGGHYDKVPVGSGVVDNGSSSIILVHLAKALKSMPLNHRIRIVWYDDEEIDHFGSRSYLA